MANDGSTSTRWAAANGNFPQWWEVDLGSAHTIETAELVFEGSSAWKFRIEGRANTTDAWTTLVDRTGNTATAQTYNLSLSNGSNKRYVRVTITGYSGGYFWASLFEARLFGQASASPPPPAGAVNLAANKPASASSTESGRTPAMANDGSTSTRWAAVNGNFPQWWEVDLGSAQTIQTAELVFEGSSAWKFRIEGRANTTDGWTTLVDRTGNTATAQTYNLSLSNGSNKRYVRVTITGYSGGYFWASLFEARLFGQASASTPPPAGAVNLAANKPASASSTESGRTPAMANDGSNSTRWAAANGNFPQWWEVDLGSPRNLSSTELSFEASSVWRYKIEGRAATTDGWTTLVDKSGNSVAAQNYQDSLANGSNKRYVRVTVLSYVGGYRWASFWEVKVNGQ
jgi:hypothetical protein